MGSKKKTFLIMAVVVATLAMAMVLGACASRAGVAYELYQIIPEKVDSFVYLRDLKDGLSPFLKSDYYDEISDLAFFDSPKKSDLSAPLLTKIGAIEKSCGLKLTLRRLLWVMGKRAVFYRTNVSGVPASAAILETGWFKGTIINIFSVLSGKVTKENWGGDWVWAVTTADKRIYYKNIKGYTLFSDSRELMKNQWDILTGQNPINLSGNPEVINLFTHLPKGYHILYYSTTVMSPEPSEKGLGARMRRLLTGTDAVAAAVTLTEAGADVALYAPYSPGDKKSDLARLGALPDKGAADFTDVPGETAGIVIFRAFDPEIFYTHFGKTWFSGVAEKAAYISVLSKWRQKGGFDLEGGIINNLGRGVTAALVGLGWEGERPFLKIIGSVGVKPGGEAAFKENLGKMYAYSFFDSGLQTLTFGNADISYLGAFREKMVEWNGSSNTVSVKTNPGFAFKNGRAFLFWDFSTMERLLDCALLSSMTKAGEVFERDLLTRSAPFVEAQKKMPANSYDLYCYVDGNNAVSLMENYLVNLSANYTYFLYQDSEKRLLPLLELTRQSFVSCYGGVNFGADAIEGVFVLTTKDLP